MKITLMGLEFALENLGCQALAYSFASIISDVTSGYADNIEMTALVFRQFESFNLSNSYTNIKSISIRYKSISFWKEIQKEFKESDLIVDFTGGDSFSDIYGMKRFILASSVKFLAIKSKTPFMLGPQTYGPFAHLSSKMIARYILKRSKWVFARDEMSASLAGKMGKRIVDNTTDVAFSLPYSKIELNDNKIKVGINISGLLWNGGYSFAKLALSVDYRKYIYSLLDYLCADDRFSVYLIPHVGLERDDGQESDYNVSEDMLGSFSNLKLIKNIKSPMNAKGYISAMDVFIGARMHATIAAMSSKVATIPFSYSRKFEGLFGNLGYSYVISATTETTDEAISKTVDWIENYQVLKTDVERAHKSIEILQEDFKMKLSRIIESIV